MKKMIVLLLTMAVAVSMAACGETSENTNNSVESKVENSVENSEESTVEGNEAEGSEGASIAETESTEVTEPAKELITVDADLSAFGELVNDLFVITNDQSKKTSREEIFEYLNGKGYTFYPYVEADLDNTITSEEAAAKEVFNLKPDSIINYCEKPKYSYATVTTVENVVSVVQYKISGCTEQTVNSVRETVNNAIDSGIFEGYDVEIKFDGDAESWSHLYVYFYGEPVNEASIGDYFANIHIALDTYATLMTFNLY